MKSYHLSSPRVGRRNVAPTLPKLAPIERLPRLQRVGPSASLDEHIRKLFEFYTRLGMYNMRGEACQIKIMLDSGLFQI